jgi:hypothetical protein
MRSIKIRSVGIPSFQVGMDALLRCASVLHQHLDTMRREIVEDMQRAAMAAENNGPPPARASGMGSSIFHMVNFGTLSGVDELRIKREIVVHLDRQLGDFRNLSGIMKCLAVQMGSKDFHHHLDTTHEHILPFANGVLDLRTLQFRDGRPEDMVMKGPTYAFNDYDADDPRVQELERMLAQTFTDTSLLDFFLTFGASLLRRRNRFKHF